MSEAASDLSGQWRGIFNYPDGHGATGFDVELTDAGGALSGVISEHDTLSDGRLLTARLDGRRDGTVVEFAKFYDDEAGEYDVVAYRGRVTDDGCEISGRWDIPGVFSGTFIMTRPAKAETPVAAEIAEEAR